MTVLAIENLALLCGAPDGIAQLRALLLDLATHGRLCPQLAEEEPAAALLAEVRPNEQLSAKARRGRVAVDVDPEPPEAFPLPAGWRWAKVGDIADVVRGVTYSKGDASEAPAPGLVPLLRGNNINGSLNFEKLIYVPAELVSADQRVKAGDLVVAMSSGSADLVGKAAQAVDDFPGGFGAFCGVVRSRSSALLPYLAFFFRTPFYRASAAGKGKGIGINNLQKSALQGLHIPIPPLAEQHRIVAKVDELMALCDRLEARQQDAEAAHARLVQALLDSLTQARDADEFQACWQRVSGQFPVLFTTDASIDALASTVLELAVSGRLASSSSEEVPAAQLLREVASVKAKLVDADGLRTTARDDVPPEEQYLPLPRGWSYARIGNLARFIDYRGRTPEKTTAGAPLITAKNVRPGYISREPREFIAEEEFSAWMTRGFPRVGDMLFTTEAPLGNVALIDIDERFALAQRVICFQLHRLDMGPYLRVAFMSRSVQKQILDMATGMTATGVKASRLKELPLPIPPLGEQHRIVAKVTELLALCDQLKARITAARAKRAQLADALVHTAVQP